MIYFSNHLIPSHFRVRLFRVAAFVVPIARVAIDPNDIRLVLRIDCLARGWLRSGERAPGENRHAVSLPTMIVGFARYSRDRSFAVLAQNRSFVLVMAAGSIAGSFIVSVLRNAPNVSRRNLVSLVPTKSAAWPTCFGLPGGGREFCLAVTVENLIKYR